MIINNQEYLYEFQVRSALVEYISSHGSKKEAANALGITPQMLTDLLADRKRLSDKICSKLGYARVEMFIKIES